MQVFKCSAVQEDAICRPLFRRLSRCSAIRGGRAWRPRFRLGRRARRPSRIASQGRSVSQLSLQGPVGVKPDGGGCTRGCGRVGQMAVGGPLRQHAACHCTHCTVHGPLQVHRAACNRDAEAIKRLVQEDAVSVNEVEAAGNTPLHNAAFEGWLEGAELLLSLGAKVSGPVPPLRKSRNRPPASIAPLLLR